MVSASAVIPVCISRVCFLMMLVDVFLEVQMFSNLVWSPRFTFEMFRVFGVHAMDLETLTLPKLRVV